jgi:hypothetical protein
MPANDPLPTLTNPILAPRSRHSPCQGSDFCLQPQADIHNAGLVTRNLPGLRMAALKLDGPPRNC